MWQPIETAPKEGGERYLVAAMHRFGGNVAGMVIWLGGPTISEEVEIDLGGEPERIVSGWYISDGHNDPIWYRGWPQLTHWMPLPEPPA